MTTEHAGHSATSPDGDRRAVHARATWTRSYDGLVVIAVGLSLALWVASGVPLTPIRPWVFDHLRQLSLFLGIGLVSLACLRFAIGVSRFGRVRGRWVRALAARHIGWRRIKEAWRYVLAFIVVITVHTSIKQAIPLISPGTTDDALIRVEKAVHLGFNPAWDLRFNLAHPWVTVFLDAAYFLWFPGMPLVTAYFMSHRDPRKRDHYLRSFMAIWIIGVMIGLAAPSHGPCYVSPGEFPSPGMDIARMLQTLVWEQYVATREITLTGLGNLKLGCGLMAMPSMHLTVCCLYAVFFWNEGKWLRRISVAYALVIFLGSLYSGWHYAIDGYAGLVIAWLTARWTAQRALPTARSVSADPATLSSRVLGRATETA